MSATRPQCLSQSPNHAMADVASPLLHLQPALHRRVEATSSRFQMARFKLLVRQVAQEETAHPLLLEAPEAHRLEALHLHRRVEARTLVLAALITVLSAHQLLAVTPSAQAHSALQAVHHRLATPQQHQADLRLIAETHLTRPATAAAVHALVLNAHTPAAVPAVPIPPALRLPLAEQTSCRSALFPRSAWPLWSLLLHSHSDRVTTINIFGHQAKVRDFDSLKFGRD